MIRPTRRSALGVAVVLSVLAVGFVEASSAPAGAEPVSLVLYFAPVDAEVSDPFRPPSNSYGSGNRGLEYSNHRGATVIASADGQVVFAGEVAGRGVVSIDHYDFVTTTYTGMSDIWVEAGVQVARQSVIGVAAAGLHFGAVRNGHYLDPQILIDASQPGGPARLVAGH